jgi:acyl carrier protein
VLAITLDVHESTKESAMAAADTEFRSDVAAAPSGAVPASGPGESHTFAALVELVGRIAPIDIDPAALTRETTLAGDLMLDSISLISLMALAEAHFGVALSEQSEAVANLRTLGDALDLVVRLQAACA